MTGRLWAVRSATSALLALTSLAACGGSHEQGPDADPAGLFPRHFTERAFTEHATLVSATAARASTRTYAFDVDLPSDHAFAFVANCTDGRVTMTGATTRCRGRATGLVGICTGDTAHFVAHVSAGQRRSWGIAIYRMPAC